MTYYFLWWKYIIVSHDSRKFSSRSIAVAGGAAKTTTKVIGNNISGESEQDDIFNYSTMLLNFWLDVEVVATNIIGVSFCE